MPAAREIGAAASDQNCRSARCSPVAWSNASPSLRTEANAAADLGRVDVSTYALDALAPAIDAAAGMAGLECTVVTM